MEFNKQHALKVLSFWLQTEFFNTLDLKHLLPGADDGVVQGLQVGLPVSLIY
jgi:hypothetical protein